MSKPVSKSYGKETRVRKKLNHGHMQFASMCKAFSIHKAVNKDVIRRFEIRLIEGHFAMVEWIHEINLSIKDTHNKFK
jgi:hypothetical protein